MARILCPHCRTPLQITTTKQVTKTVRDVYANCNNNDCLARPVMTISHKCDRQPPISQLTGTGGLLEKLFGDLDKKDRDRILNKFANAN